MVTGSTELQVTEVIQVKKVYRSSSGRERKIGSPSAVAAVKIEGGVGSKGEEVEEEGN